MFLKILKRLKGVMFMSNHIIVLIILKIMRMIIEKQFYLFYNVKFHIRCQKLTNYYPELYTAMIYVLLSKLSYILMLGYLEQRYHILKYSKNKQF